MISSKKKVKFRSMCNEGIARSSERFVAKKRQFFFFYNKYNDSELFLMSTFFFAKKVLTANGSK
jgi:hypothetical protein